MTTGSFGFVLNLYEYSGTLPLELSPGIFFDAATPEQRVGIELFLKDYESSFIGGTHVYFVERYLDSSEIPGQWVWPPSGSVPLWVLNFSPGAGSVWEFCKVAQLTESELEIALTFHPTRPPMPHQIEPARIFHFSQSHINPVFQSLDAADLTRSKDFADKIRDFRA